MIGRFTQEDTYYGDGLNLYEYGRNNPMRYIDPSGHEVRAAAEKNYVNRAVDAMNKAADQGVDGILERVYGDKNSSKTVDLSKYTKLSTDEVSNILRLRGLDDKSINDLINSFSGPIYQRIGYEGDIFIITESNIGDASGVFVTRGSAGITAVERIDKLALPPNNTALFESQIELARTQILLEGKVAPQPDWSLIANDGIPRNGGAWQVVTDGGKYSNAIVRR